MPRWMSYYVHYIDLASTYVGKVALYLVFVMMAILMYAVISRAVFNAPVIWAMEMSQFTMAAYYTLGGAFSMLLRSHVRMDVVYCRWSMRTQAKVNLSTSIFLLIFMAILLYGSLSSTVYSIQYNQHTYSAWAPPIAPIKCIMTFGIFLMLLQCISDVFKEIARMKAVVIDGNVPDGYVDEFESMEFGMRSVLIPEFILPPTIINEQGKYGDFSVKADIPETVTQVSGNPQGTAELTLNVTTGQDRGSK